MRFDNFVAQRLNISRNKASELIKSSKVMLNSQICNKPSFECESGEIALLDEVFVGRGALKLRAFLDAFNFDLKDKTVLDIGSSTGGFIQILLRQGVKSVVGVDVGEHQLDDSLRADERVKIYENTDIRAFENEFKFEFITCDVSFISVVEILNAIDTNADKNATIIILFKPQFEVGKYAKRSKKGVVTDKNAIAAAIRRFEIAVSSLKWIRIAQAECEIKGKEGNAEFFYAFNKG
ncbi:TlyA family RNA methyltransferase [Campylobacter sp. faydin G-105]|uniref:23S rRNA (cytidine-2'-O)-methyltransferase TlyA n=1 Tax=Campylobacter anatolicus TaxID=2829105 RepID=UPI001BA0299E|nr:TlyA family RNA methyltransferase [Campylobacter anatolicus]MBR8462855.1 TlyA family RNA methyltransferase [Campylobacter anatolicus]